MLLVLAALVSGGITCLVMGIRWNRRHGYRTGKANPYNEDDVWWMTPERTRAALRTIRRAETVHDHEAARDVCARARARLIMLRNPWHPVLFPVAMVFNVLVLPQSLNLFGGDRTMAVGPYAALVLGTVAVTGLVAALWRTRAVRKARDAFLAHRDIAGETRELPLPAEDTP